MKCFLTHFFLTVLILHLCLYLHVYLSWIIPLLPTLRKISQSLAGFKIFVFTTYFCAYDFSVNHSCWCHEHMLSLLMHLQSSSWLSKLQLRLQTHILWNSISHCTSSMLENNFFVLYSFPITNRATLW